VQFDNLKPLQPHHLRDARLFSDRFQQMLHIHDLLGQEGIDRPSILEIGVGFGWFSKFLIHTFNPRRFAGLDLFQFHTYDELWGVNVADTLKGRPHADFYRDEISAMFDGELIVAEGPSSETIAQLADASFDVIYIDASHVYHEVIADARASLLKVRPGGFIVFNDYTMTDHLSRVEYGVVKAANEIIDEDDRLKVIGFALDPQMFCDLAVRVGD
jgi:hypothetical protein